MSGVVYRGRPRPPVEGGRPRPPLTSTAEGTRGRVRYTLLRGFARVLRFATVTGEGARPPLLLFLILFAVSLHAQSPRLIDDFESVSAWSAHPSDGVELKIGSDAGLHGRAMRLDFDFKEHAGYAIARRDVDLDLPANYEFVFAVRANSRVNNFELKLIDDSGENVWWINRREFVFPHDWRELVTRKRQISFAWGPRGGGELKHVAAMEIVVTAGEGGAGSVWIDDLQLIELSATSPRPAPRGAWRAPDGTQQWTYDFGALAELSGLRILWDAEDYATDFDVELSRDGTNFVIARSVKNNRRIEEFLHLPDEEARAVRLTLRRSSRGKGYAMRGVDIEPPEWAPTENDFFANIAKGARRGFYPRYFIGEQSYWTTIGADAADEEALFSEDAAAEPYKRGFSLEPFLFSDGKLMSWADCEETHSLTERDLPIPTTTRKCGGVTLSTTAAVTADSMLLLRYRVRGDSGDGPLTLFVAARPFQVNPSTQFLNIVGGVAHVRSVTLDGEGARFGGGEEIRTLTPPARSGVATFDEGDITDYLTRGDVGAATGNGTYVDPTEHLSVAFEYPLQLSVGRETEIHLAVPMKREAARADVPPPPSDRHSATITLTLPAARGALQLDPVVAFKAVEDEWHEKLHRVAVEIPAAPDVADTLRTSVAYMLIHRNGPALEPGSRSYDRAWIRDGALMAATLLRLGHADVAKSFAEWYAPFQFDSGKVPCCVDARGADPVPENDSHGELIYLIAEIVRYTGDLDLARRLWPHVDRAARYIEELRSQNHGESEGLVTESISHEGYSAKPMHSYWDDFFALKGMEDAVFLAGALGLEARADELRAQAAAFRRDFAASIQRSMASHHIDYIPGSAELGDFDATSTAIAISPLSMRSFLPEAPLQRTFARYLESLEKPRADYTPYEMRIIGALVRMGDRDHVAQLVERFLSDRRPAEWNEWGEVVATDPRRPIFVGDMPHAWVASDFVRSILDAFAFDREDGTLVIAGGVPSSWITDAPLHVGPLPTYSGTIDLTMRRKGKSLSIAIDGSAKAPIVVRAPQQGARSIRINGKRVKGSAEEIAVPSLPARIELLY